jgi:hypothetical protein
MSGPNLDDAILALRTELEKARRRGELLPSAQGVVGKVAGSLSLPDSLQDFYRDANPTDVEIPWLVERLSLYSVDDLESSQEGYRFDARGPKKLAAGWNPEWIVIGDCSGDPIIVDATRSESPVLMALHGAGSWSPVRVSPSLADFLHVLAKWLRFWLSVDGHVRDDDGVLRPEVAAHFDHEVSAHLSDSDRKNLLTFVD